ncbi:hypothetical protein SBA4_1420004 [Candidatus Sulfopaludibacter sp. SbA4]|nr:hypothetical protein SBA4_1420004 [Candidatus Sulfopaludibacter sp. SbA4]
MESPLQDLGRAEGLPDEAVELFENVASAVGLVVSLPAFDSAFEDARPGELREIALHGPRAAANGADDLPLVEPFAGMDEEQTKHGAAGSVKERWPNRLKGVGIFC